MAPYGLGLELGMTSIAVAVADGTSVQVIPASADTANPEVPAVVYAAHGRFATGGDAARRAIGSPDRLATGVLGNVAARTPVVIDSAGYPADAVLGTMVHNVLAHVTDSRGEPPQRVTVTHPTHWAADEVAALADAVRPVTAGVGTLQLVPNLIAAAMHYASTHTMLDGDTVAIVDVGATGFEAAVVARRDNQVLLLSPQIERGAIGGDHFDAAVLGYVDQVTAGAVSALNASSLQGQITLARLRRDCRIAKETLSTARSVDMTAYLPTGTTTVSVSRTMFEEAIRPQVDVLIGAVVRALRSSPDVQPQTLVLTGGSAQVPLVQRLISAIKGVPEVSTVRHAAARGAAALAAVPAVPVARPASAAGPSGSPLAGGDDDPQAPADASDPVDAPDPGLPDGPAAPVGTTPLDPGPQATPAVAADGAAAVTPADPGHDGPTSGQAATSAPDRLPDPHGPTGLVPGLLNPQQHVDERDPQAHTGADGPVADDAVATGLPLAPATHPARPSDPLHYGTDGRPDSEAGGSGGGAVSAPARPRITGITAPLIEPGEPAAAGVATSWPEPAADRPDPGWPAGGWPGGDWRGHDGTAGHDSPGAGIPGEVAAAGPPAAPAGPDLGDHWPQAPPSDRRASPLGGRRGPVAVAAVVAVALILFVGYVVIQRSGILAAPGGESVGAPTAAAAPTNVTTVVVAPPPQPAASGPAASSDAVTAAALIPAGTTPGFAAISPSGRQVYIANRGGGRPTGGLLTVVDTATDTVSTQIQIPEGPAQYLAFAPDGSRLYVSIFTESGRGPNKVDVIDTATNTITASIDVGSRPFALAASPDGSQVWVPNHDSGTVSVIDARTNQLVVDIRVPANPHSVAFSADGSRAYTANHESNMIAVLDTASRSVVAQIPVGTSPHSVAVHPGQPLVANVNYDADSVSLIDTTTESVVGAAPGCRVGCTTIKVGHHPQDLAWAPDGRHLYVTNVEDHTVSVINLDKRAVTATIPVGTSPTSITVTPDGEKAYVTNLADGTVQVLKLT